MCYCFYLHQHLQGHMVTSSFLLVEVELTSRNTGISACMGWTTDARPVSWKTSQREMFCPDQDTTNYLVGPLIIIWCQGHLFFMREEGNTSKKPMCSFQKTAAVHGQSKASYRVDRACTQSQHINSEHIKKLQGVSWSWLDVTMVTW